MKKRISAWLLVLICFVPFYSVADDAAPKPVAKKQDLQHFDTINLSGVGNLYIKQSDQENFTLEADETLLPLIKVNVKDKTLYINLEDASEHLKAKINYYLNIKTLNSITANGLTNVFIPSGIQTNTLKLSINGLGAEADININVKQLILKVESGAKVLASGIANTQIININGAGEFDGTKLVGDTGTIEINGSSVAKTNIAGNLTANVSGDGVVQYCGKPNITQNIDDNGKVSRLESGC